MTLTQLIGELQRITDPSTAATTFEVDANGYKTADIDALNRWGQSH